MTTGKPNALFRLRDNNRLSAVRPLTPILRDVIFLYLVEGFQMTPEHKYPARHC